MVEQQLDSLQTKLLSGDSNTILHGRWDPRRWIYDSLAGDQLHEVLNDG